MKKQNHELHNTFKYEMKFISVDEPFSVFIFYCVDCQIPFHCEWMTFEDSDKNSKAHDCEHNVDQLKCYRFYVKNNPKAADIKPFTMKLYTCPMCDFPVEYRFITYEGDLKDYPRVRDLKKHFKSKKKKKKFKIPPASVSERYGMGV